MLTRVATNETTNATTAAPGEMLMEPVALSELARRHGLEHRGPDCEIVTVGALNSNSESVDRMLTYIIGPELIPALLDRDVAACVVPGELADDLEGRSLLVTDGDAADTFYSLYAKTTEDGLWGRLEAKAGEGNEIAASAVVHDNVQLGNDCTIMDNAVLLPNTRLGDGVTIQPNTTVGGDGFQVASIGGRPSMVPHSGGVWIGDDVHVGSSTCLDRGMFGEFTMVGDETKIDNLIHVAHSVRLGPRGVVAASTEIGGITAGEGFWLAPQCCVLQGANLGHHSYVGIGSTVVREVPPHALAFGVPARQHGWVCTCRTKLDFGDGDSATCPRCGRRWKAGSEGIAEQ